ncbi:hypothetical protein KAI87_05790, partial [Myxococcota bacterium]|nr:hypothetical protein [Myxococcota bacterium]
DGVRFELLSAKAKQEHISVRLMAYNDLNEEVVINRNQIAVVLPAGVEHFRRSSRKIHKVKPHGKHKVYIDIKQPGGNFLSPPGAWVRFDGVYANGMRLNVPPMRLDQPGGSPGQVNASFQAPAYEEPGRGTKIQVNLSEGTITTQDTSSSSGSSGKRAMRSYSGPRARLQTPGLKCAAIPLKAMDISDQLAFVVDDFLLGELQQAGFEAIGPDDINAMLGFEEVKDAVGCDDAACIAELGNALGVDYLVAGSLASLDGSLILTLKLIDVRNTRVVARVNKMGEGGQSSLPRILAGAVNELIQRSKL